MENKNAFPPAAADKESASLPKMQPTPEFLKREFLYDYFFFDATVGLSLTAEGRRDIFDLYAKLYTITDKAWLDTCFATAEHELARKAITGDTVNRLLRCIELYESLSSLFAPILPFKLKAAFRRDEIFEKDIPIEITHTLYSLEKASAEGNVPATALLGFLSLKGYLSDTEKEETELRLLKAMHWGSPMTLLLIAEHFPEKREECSALLASLLSHRGEKEVYTYLTEVLELPPAMPSPVAEALEEAFERKLLKRTKIVPDSLRIIRSTVLTDASKRTLLLTDPASYPGTLPMNITKKSLPLMPKKLPEGVFHREREDSLIENNLLCRLSKRKRPLLLVGRDNIVLNSFKERISAAYPEKGVGTVDLENIIFDNMEFTFLRTLDMLGENGPILFVENCEKLNENGTTLLSKFLREESTKYYVTQSGHTLDLSDVVIVLLAHERPDKKLATLCDTVILENVQSDEAETALDKMLSDFAKAFALESITAEPDARKLLLGHTANTAEAFIEHAVLAYRTTEASFVIKANMLSDGTVQTATKIGIWGGN